jgi:hypothetical protein
MAYLLHLVRISIEQLRRLFKVINKLSRARQVRTLQPTSTTITNAINNFINRKPNIVESSRRDSPRL